MKNLRVTAKFPVIKKLQTHWQATVALLTFGLAVGAIICVLNQLPTRLMADGDDHFWQSQFYEADVVYSRALMISMNDERRSQAYSRLCRLYSQQSDFDAALAACQAAVQTDPDSPQPQIEVARTYLVMERYEQARQYASRALELDGEDAGAAAVYGKILAAEAAGSGGDFTQAVSFCEYSLSLDDSYADAHQALGYINQLQGNYDEAAENFRKALEIKPGFAAYYIDLGYAETRQNHIAAAMEAFDAAIELLPESAQALNGRGWGAWTQGDYQQARLDFKQALLLDEDSDSWAGLGWTYYYDGGSALAQNAFEQALDLNPENASAISGLEVLQTMTGEPEQVMAQIDHETASVNAVQKSTVSQQVLDDAIMAAVKVYAFDDTFTIKSSCSGMVISPDGFVLTNLHCIRDAESQRPYNELWMAGIGVVDDIRQPPEQRYRAQMVALDDGLDVVLLQIVSDWAGNPLAGEPDLAAVKIGDSDQLSVGDMVWAAGYPGMGGETLTLTQGMVSGYAVQDGLSWIKTDLMTGPGNSGGMVVNAAGELVGIHAQSWLDQGVSSSRLSAELPVNYLENLLQFIE